VRRIHPLAGQIQNLGVDLARSAVEVKRQNRSRARGYRPSWLANSLCPLRRIMRIRMHISEPQTKLASAFYFVKKLPNRKTRVSKCLSLVTLSPALLKAD
jgi:hypothetical protein